MLVVTNFWGSNIFMGNNFLEVEIFGSDKVGGQKLFGVKILG